MAEATSYCVQTAEELPALLGFQSDFTIIGFKLNHLRWRKSDDEPSEPSELGGSSTSRYKIIRERYLEDDRYIRIGGSESGSWERQNAEDGRSVARVVREARFDVTLGVEFVQSPFMKDRKDKSCGRKLCIEWRMVVALELYWTSGLGVGYLSICGLGLDMDIVPGLDAVQHPPRLEQ